MIDPKLKNALRAIQCLGEVLAHHVRRHGVSEGARDELSHLEGEVATALGALDALPGPTTFDTSRVFPAVPELDPATAEDASLMLSLVDVNVTEDEVAGWTQEQREKAVAWAAALHLKASDNHVEIPPRPDFLPGAPNLLDQLAKQPNIAEKIFPPIPEDQAKEDPDGLVLPGPMASAVAKQAIEQQRATEEKIARSLMVPAELTTPAEKILTHVLRTFEASVDIEALCGEECEAHAWDWRYMRHALQSIQVTVLLEKGLSNPPINVVRVRAEGQELLPALLRAGSPGVDWLKEQIVAAHEAHKDDTPWQAHLAAWLHEAIEKLNPKDQTDWESLYHDADKDKDSYRETLAKAESEGLIPPNYHQKYHGWKTGETS